MGTLFVTEGIKRGRKDGHHITKNRQLKVSVYNVGQMMGWERDYTCEYKTKKCIHCMAFFH